MADAERIKLQAEYEQFQREHAAKLREEYEEVKQQQLKQERERIKNERETKQEGEYVALVQQGASFVRLILLKHTFVLLKLLKEIRRFKISKHISMKFPLLTWSFVKKSGGELMQLCIVRIGLNKNKLLQLRFVSSLKKCSF